MQPVRLSAVPRTEGSRHRIDHFIYWKESSREGARGKNKNQSLPVSMNLIIIIIVCVIIMIITTVAIRKRKDESKSAEVKKEVVDLKNKK